MVEGPKLQGVPPVEDCGPKCIKACHSRSHAAIFLYARRAVSRRVGQNKGGIPCALAHLYSAWRAFFQLFERSGKSHWGHESLAVMQFEPHSSTRSSSFEANAQVHWLFVLIQLKYDISDWGDDRFQLTQYQFTGKLGLKPILAKRGRDESSLLQTR